jgi:quercetin dioxygenase-like cupin family protein
MPIFSRNDAVEHNAHGSSFCSYVVPSRGSTQLCAWRLEVPAGLRGLAHRPTREEVLLLLDGELQITLDGAPTQLGPGDVALVPAGSELRVDGGANGATAWVTTTPGLEAVIADGTRISPPWAS